MSSNPRIQFSVGVFALFSCLCLVFIIVFGVKDSFIWNNKQNTYYANFDEVAGLYPSAPVRIAGVSVGLVKSISLRNDDFRAKVEIAVDSNIKIPTDSSIKVYTDGVLGAKYLSIVPGYGEVFMKKNDGFNQTESAIVLESLISEFISGFVSNGEKL